ncbi:unnamed protein product [Urochloa humidicola]
MQPAPDGQATEKELHIQKRKRRRVKDDLSLLSVMTSRILNNGYLILYCSILPWIILTSLVLMDSSERTYPCKIILIRGCRKFTSILSSIQLISLFHGIFPGLQNYFEKLCFQGN